MKTRILSTLLSAITFIVCAQSPWTQKEAEFSSARWGFATCVVNGKIYAFGGLNYGSSVLATVEVYDPTTDIWTKKNDMPAARAGLSTSVVNGKIYAIGGISSPVTALHTVEVYDPATDTWITKSPMPTARGWHSANVLDGKIYVIGGSTEAPHAGNAILVVEVYDPATDTWIQKGNIPRRIGSGFSSIVDGKIYAFGGFGGLNKVHEYDPVTDTWTNKANMPTGRCGFSASVCDGKIYSIGGHNGNSPDLALSTVEIYDPATDTWTTATNMLTARAGLLTSVVNEKIYAFGGYTGTWLSSMCVTIEEYDPTHDLFPFFESIGVDKGYVKPGIDSVRITTKMKDTSGIELLVEINAPEQTPVDSLPLFDDGNHNDGVAGDSLYENVWKVGSSEEKLYYIDLLVIRIGMDTIIQQLNNMAAFTTIGPIEFDTYSFIGDDTEPNPGDWLNLEVTLKNNGSTATATNITTRLTTDDDLVDLSTHSRSFGDIPAGESAAATSTYPIRIRDTHPTNSEVSIIAHIFSEDFLFWNDTFSFSVLEPDIVNNTLESHIRIYPNPATGELTIEFDKEQTTDTAIELLDISGKVVYTTTINPGETQHQINLSSFEEGLYLIRISNTDYTVTKKVIKVE